MTIPPKTDAEAPKPAKTTKPATANDDAESGNEAQALAGKTTKPTATRKQTAPATEEPAADVAADDSDDGAPDLQAVQNVQTGDDSKLALTGANSMTYILGGALLMLCGVVLLRATRRRRAADRD